MQLTQNLELEWRHDRRKGLIWKKSEVKGHHMRKMWMGFLAFIILIFSIGPTTGASSRHYGGLNKWSFLSGGEGELNSDLLCPNPMLDGNENRIISSSSYYHTSTNFSGRGTIGGPGSTGSSSLIVKGDGINPNTPVPNDIWALKTYSDITFLPCSLQQRTTNIGSRSRYQASSSSSASSTENKILYMNISLEPFDFERAENVKSCTKFIKLQYDEDEGVDIACDENSLLMLTDIITDDAVASVDATINHIYWPKQLQKRRKYFSLFESLEKFLQYEERLQQRFYFQIYFMSASGGSGQNYRKCTMQQYELNLPSPGCNARRPHPRIENLCGEFNTCDDLAFPLYGDGRRVRFMWKSGEDGKPVVYPKDDSAKKGGGVRNISSAKSFSTFFSNRKLDVRFVVFITVLPILLFGMLIFSLEIIIYLTCLRPSRASGDSRRDARSNQIMQNSLNLWESMPNREARSVSFSPVTTNIDGSGGPVVVGGLGLPGSESPLPPDPMSTPRVLKSALKKSTEILPPPPASFFDREYPPTYVEAMKH